MTKLATLGMALVVLGTAGCEYQRQDLPKDLFDQGEYVTLTLERAEDGDLEYCKNEGDDCSQHANPDGCHTLQIRVNDVTGDVCERCLDADGAELVEDRCEGTWFSCTVAK